MPVYQGSRQQSHYYDGSQQSDTYRADSNLQRYPTPGMGYMPFHMDSEPQGFQNQAQNQSIFGQNPTHDGMGL